MFDSPCLHCSPRQCVALNFPSPILVDSILVGSTRAASIPVDNTLGDNIQVASIRNKAVNILPASTRKVSIRRGSILNPFLCRDGGPATKTRTATV
jgi:hypothetical protein